MLQNDKTTQILNLLIGAYTPNNNEGISVYRFYTETGRLVYLNGIQGINNPSYLCVSSNGRFIYSVNENDYNEPGGVSAFSFEPETGTIKLINQQQTDPGPCYISVDVAQKYAFVANYAGGSLSVFPLGEDGSLLPICQKLKHDGSGPNEERQDKPHVHAAILQPDEKHVLFTDLGTDQVHIYSYQPSEPLPLSPATLPSLNVIPGHGPRHIDYTPDKRFMYLITEMGGSVYVYTYNGSDYKQVQTISLVDDDFKGDLGGGDLHVSPDGRFVYASNRGDANEVVVFSIDTTNGNLSFVERVSSMGQSPRNLAIDPSGNYLLVANQDSNDVYVYRINKQNGMLTLTDSKLLIDSPCCLKFTSVN